MLTGLPYIPAGFLPNFEFLIDRARWGGPCGTLRIVRHVGVYRLCVRFQVFLIMENTQPHMVQ